MSGRGSGRRDNSPIAARATRSGPKSNLSLVRSASEDSQISLTARSLHPKLASELNRFAIYKVAPAGRLRLPACATFSFLVDQGDAKEPVDRAAQLFLERWREQLGTSYTPRRARTLGACAALEELAALAESWIRSGGQLRPAVDPDEGGHGVAMLPDVAAETERTVRDDIVLGRRHQHRRDVLAETARRLKSEKADEIREALGVLQAVLATVRPVYLRDSFDEVLSVVKAEPFPADDVVGLAEGIMSELRASGWTDVGLSEAADLACGASKPTASSLQSLRDMLLVKPTDFTCYVSLTLPKQRIPFPADVADFALVDNLPPGNNVGRPQKRGTHVRAVVRAVDPTAAAILAHRRVLATIGALTVSLPASRIDVSSDIVGVLLPDGTLRGCEVQDRLINESERQNQTKLCEF